LNETSGTIRIDKWLWFARQAKTRGAAQKLVTGGKVRLNREKIVNSARQVRPGDVITVSLQHGVNVLRIVDCGTRRGSYPEAQLLYEDLTRSQPAESGQDT